MPSTRVITVRATEPVQVLPSKEIKPAIEVVAGVEKEVIDAQSRSALVARAAAAAKQTFRAAQTVSSANLAELELALQEAEKEAKDAHQAETLVQARARESRELLARAVIKDFSKFTTAIKDQKTALSASGSGDKPPHDHNNKGHTHDPADEPVQGTPAPDHFGAFLVAVRDALYRAEGELLRVGNILLQAEQDAITAIIRAPPPAEMGSAEIERVAQRIQATIQQHLDQAARVFQDTTDLGQAARDLRSLIDFFLDNGRDPVQNFDEAEEITDILYGWARELERTTLAQGVEGAMLRELAQHLQHPGLDTGLFEPAQTPFLTNWLP